MTTSPTKLEPGKTIYTDEPIRLLGNVENEGLVRLATMNGGDLFEANVHPHTPITTLRHCGRFNDYKDDEGAVRPVRPNEWAITLVEQAGAASSGRR